MAGPETRTEERPEAGQNAGPFRGLEYYTEADAEWFFGRAAERRIIIARLRTARLTLLYAESGVGKSSVLRAGVAARLRDLATRSFAEEGSPEFVPVVCKEWKDDPVAALVTEIEARARVYSNGLELPRNDLAVAIKTAASALDATFVIVLDQFEEFFAYQEHPEELAKELAACINARDVRANFLIAIREDAYGKIGDFFAGRVDNAYSNYFHLEYLTRRAASEAIYGPVDAYSRLRDDRPIEVGEGLADAVLDQVRRGNLTLGSGTQKRGDRNPPASSGDEIEAPFLQLVMARVWEREAEAWEHEMEKRPRVLRKGTLDELGGAEKIVSDHFDRALGVLTVTERETATDILARLVTPSGAKLALTAADLARIRPPRPVEEVSAVLAKLGRKRIVRDVDAAPGSEDGRYEIFHDKLANPILELRAQQENAQLMEEKQRAEDDARKQRTQAARFRLLAIVCVLALGGAVFLWLYARDQRQSAVNEAAAGSSLALASEAQVTLAERPDVSLLLGIAAYRIRPLGAAASAITASLEAFRRTGVLGILHGNVDTVNAVAFSPDRRTLASAGGDGTIRFWNARTGRQIGDPLVSSLTDGVMRLAFSRDGRTLASAGGYDPTVRLWNVRTHAKIGQPLRVDPKKGYAYDVAFSPDGRTLATATQYNGIGLWDARTRRPLGSQIECHCGKVVSVAFSPSGRTLASGGYDRTIRLWALGRKPRLVARLAGHTGPIYAVTFSHDGRTLGSAATDGTARLWDVSGRTPLGKPHRGRAGSVLSVAFSPDDQELASAGADATVRLWSVHNRRELGNPFTGHSGTVMGVAFSPDGHTLASGGVDRTIRLWRLPVQHRFGEPLISGAGAVDSLAVNRVGNALASGGDEGTIRLWDAQTRSQLGPSLVGHGGRIDTLAFSPGGNLLASGSDDGNIRLWGVRSHAELAKLPGTRRLLSIAFSPNGRTLASADGSDIVKLWDVRSRPAVTRIQAGQSGVESVAFSPDGSRLASAGADRTIRLWDARSHASLVTLHGSRGPVLSVEFSPDSRTLASGGDDKSIRLWNVRNGAGVGTLAGSTGQIRTVAFSPDGHTLASGGSDNAVRLWDTMTDSELGPPLMDNGNRVNSVAFTSDGHAVASASQDTTVRLWEGIFWSGLAGAESQACALTGTGLSRLEWRQYVSGIQYHASC